MDIDLKIAACLLVAGVALAAYIDREQIRTFWQNTVGAWFARRRSLIRVPAPDEHSPGIMVMRRDVNTGWWT